MVSPNLIRREEDNPPILINDNTKRLFQVIYSEQNKALERDDETPKIKVSTLISRLAFFYEKVRNAVDYDEEHLLRKNAIARILRRQVMIEGVIKENDSQRLAEHLLIELIRASYLANGKVPETKVQEIANLLEKYIRLKNQTVLKINAELNLKTDINKAKELIKSKNQLIRWLLTLAACEIEENLGENRVKQMIVNNMFDVLVKNIRLPENLPYKNDLEIQIYLSVVRTFLKFDKDMLSFVLFKYYNGQWADFDKQAAWNEADTQKIKKISTGIYDLKNLIEAQIKHPLVKKLDRIVRLYSLYFTVLSGAIEQDPSRTYSDLQKGEKAFLSGVAKVCRSRYKRAKARLWRAAVRSIIYIFLTKSIFAVLIEIPAIKWFNESFSPFSLAINIAFPALLLFLIVFFTRTPGEKNTEKILEGIKEIAFSGSEKKQPITLRPETRRSQIVNWIFNLIYVASFSVSIYFIIWALGEINFNWVSITIFLFFLAFVSFFSEVVTKGIKELIIIERRENLFTFIIDLFYMPIILVGRWLSRNVSKINIFIFIFDFIIEAPFKILVEIAEDWTKYIRERRDNLQ